MALTHPQDAYAAFNHGISSQWTYLSHVQPDLEQHLLNLDKIRKKFLPALCGHPVADADMPLLGLPACLGGLSIGRPSHYARAAYNSATTSTKPIVQHLVDPSSTSSTEAMALQRSTIADDHTARLGELSARAAVVKANVPSRTQRAIERAQERGASSWLTALPIADYGSLCRSVSFTTPCVSAMGGYHPSSRPPAPVAWRSQLSMSSAVHDVATLRSATTRYVTCWRSYWRKRVITWKSSLNYSRSTVNLFTNAARPPQKELGLTSKPVDSGAAVGMRWHILMFGCSTPMPTRTAA